MCGRPQVQQKVSRVENGVKSKVARDFRPLDFFFHVSTPNRPKIQTQKYFRILFRTRGDILIRMLLQGV